MIIIIDILASQKAHINAWMKCSLYLLTHREDPNESYHESRVDDKMKSHSAKNDGSGLIILWHVESGDTWFPQSSYMSIKIMFGF